MTSSQKLALAVELGLPEGYHAELLLESKLLSPGFITATSDDQLLVAEHHGARLLRIDPVTADVQLVYQLPHGKFGGALLSDGTDGAYLSVEGHIAHIAGDGTYTIYSPGWMHPAALGPDGEIYGRTQSDVLVIRAPGQEPETVATGFSGIFDLVRAQDGTLYVSDWDRGTITRIDPNGTQNTLPAAVNQGDPIDLSFTPDGTLYVLEGTAGFHQVDLNSGILTTISWFGGSGSVHPIAFTFLSDGTAYFVDPTYNNLIRVDLQTKQIDFVIIGEGNSPALDVGPDGAVYIASNSGFPSRRAQVLRVKPNDSIEVYADNLDAVTDLSFAPDGSLFVTTWYHDPKLKYDASSILLITPQREVQILAHWDSQKPGLRKPLSVSVDPKTGLAIVYDNASDQLISIDKGGNISILPHSFHFDTFMVYLAHAADGTLYAIEVNEEGYHRGPFVERNIIRFGDAGHPEIITDLNHIGCCTGGNLDIGPDGNIYTLAFKLEGNDFCLWRITPDGQKTLLTDRLPVDPLGIATDAQGNIYVCCSAGLFRIYP